MAFLNVKNRASSTLAAAITSTDTSLTVATGEGAKFPASNFHITIDDEILLCTTRTNDTLTVQRGKEGTTAAAHSAGAKVELRITAQIITELQNRSKARAYRSGTSQTITTNTWTKVQLNGESYDELGELDSVTNYRFTATKAGYYLILGATSWSGVADGKIYAAAIYKNGVAVTKGYFHSGSTASIIGMVHDIIYLNVNDYVELFCYHNTGVDATVDCGSEYTFMVIHQISI